MSIINVCDLCGKQVYLNQQNHTELVIMYAPGGQHRDMPHKILICGECLPEDTGKQGWLVSAVQAYARFLGLFHGGAK